MSYPKGFYKINIISTRERLMKKFLFYLVLISTSQVLPMEPEEADAQEAMKLEKIAHHPEYWNNLNPLLNLIDLKEARGQQAYKGAIDQLSTIVDLANAYNDKIQRYLNGEIATEHELSSIDRRIPIHSIVERLLLSDNPKKINALKVIVLHARALSYYNPLNYIGDYPDNDSIALSFKSLQANDAAPIRFLVNSAKPSTIPLGASTREIGLKLTIFGYLINKLPLPKLIQDKIFTYVLTDSLSKAQITQQSIYRLSLSDLHKFQSNVRALELPEDLYAKAINEALAELGQSIKSLKGMYNGEIAFTVRPGTPKTIEFNQHIRPIATQYLPDYRLN
jgi:hypothetical protein